MSKNSNAAKIARANVRKGKRHELRVSHLMKDWTGRDFRRRKVEGHDDKTISVDSTSDVIPIDGEIIVTIECKSGKGFSMPAMLTNIENNLFTKWWIQCSIDAHLLTKVKGYTIYSMLFLKPNVNVDWVALDHRLIDDELLKPIENELWLPSFKYDALKNVKIQYKDSLVQLHSCYLVDYRHLLKYIDGSSIFKE